MISEKKIVLVHFFSTFFPLSRKKKTRKTLFLELGHLVMTTFLYGQDELRMKNALFFLFSPTKLPYIKNKNVLDVFWRYITCKKIRTTLICSDKFQRMIVSLPKGKRREDGPKTAKPRKQM